MAEDHKCPGCGAEIPKDAPSGLCVACLLKIGQSNEVADSTPSNPTVRIGASFPAEEKPGDKIGHYKILQKLGEGGCGVVYEAEQKEPVRRHVALKVIKLGMDTKEVIGRFEAERQALALMDHPNICKVLDAGATDVGRPYFVMELVRGIRITSYCDDNKLNTEQRLELFIQVCQAIQHAHQKSIIHRDIKPSNILVTDQEGVPVPKVIDFGIAKATAGQTLTDKTVFTALEQFIGTPAYMSPEQAKLSGLDIDTRSDIYSLGVLLYELLTGKTPFDAKRLLEAGFDEIRRIIREEEPPAPSQKLSTLAAEEQTTTARFRQTDSPRLLHLIRGDLDWIVMKCLEKDRNRRYETANGLAFDIKRHVNNEPVVARPPSSVYRLQKMVRRNKLACAAAAAVALALLLGVVVSAWEARRAIRAEQEQNHLRQEAEAESKKAKSEADHAKSAESLAKQRLAESEANATLAKQRLADSEAISKFLTQLFRSPDPAHDGRTIKVVDILSAAAKNLETELTNQPAQRAKLQATLASTYDALGLYSEAISLQEKVRDYYLAASGLENPDTLVAIHDLAYSYDEDGRQDEALKLAEEVLARSRKELGPESPFTLKAMDSVGLLYLKAGRFEEAIKLFEELLALRRKVSGQEHRETLWAMDNLANCHDEAGHRDEALKLREQVLPLFRKVCGPEDRDTIMAMNNLAISYVQVGRRDEALKLREDVLALRRKMLGPESPYTLKAMRNLAYSYEEAGRQNEALKLREDALALRRKVSGSKHPETLATMSDLATSYDEAGRWDEALQLREETLALRRKVSGPEHYHTLVAMNDLATSYDEEGRRTEALQLREEVLGLFRKVLQPQHPYTLVAMNNLATSYDEAGRRDDALKLRVEVLELRRKVLIPDHPDTLTTMNDLAISYDEAGRRDEALKLREQVLTLRRKVSGPEHPDTFVAMENLATSYAEAGRQQEAISLLAQVCELNPKNTDAALALATWQTWFSQDADYEASRHRLVQQADGTDQVDTAERAAKAASLRPSSDVALTTNALHLAQRAVELGKTNSSLPGYQLSLGLAEYRSGQFAAAERSILAAEQTVGDHDEIQGIAQMFHAMTLFRQNRLDEARKLFSQAEAQMPPLPKDESKPMVDGRTLDHDLLIWWLAYKEAKSVLNEPARGKP
jgi:eukaryotic-like serine/threonine-protein kinase